MDALDEAVRLVAADLRGAVLDLLELQEPLVGMLVWAAAVFAAVVAQDRLQLHAVLCKEGQRVVVLDLNGGHWHLGSLEPWRQGAADAVQHGLDVDLADFLQRARKEGVYGHKFGDSAEMGESVDSWLTTVTATSLPSRR